MDSIVWDGGFYVEQLRQQVLENSSYRCDQLAREGVWCPGGNLRVADKVYALPGCKPQTLYKTTKEDSKSKAAGPVQGEVPGGNVMPQTGEQLCGEILAWSRKAYARKDPINVLKEGLAYWDACDAEDRGYLEGFLDKYWTHFHTKNKLNCCWFTSLRVRTIMV